MTSVSTCCSCSSCCGRTPFLECSNVRTPQSCFSCEICLLPCEMEKKERIHDYIKCLLITDDADVFIHYLQKGVNEFCFIDEETIGFREFLRILAYGTSKELNSTRFWKMQIVCSGRASAVSKKLFVFNKGVSIVVNRDVLIESIYKRDKGTGFDKKYWRFCIELLKSMDGFRPTLTNMYIPPFFRTTPTELVDKYLKKYNKNENNLLFRLDIPE